MSRHEAYRSPTSGARFWTWTWKSVLFAALVALSAEALLQAASLFVGVRSDGADSAAAHRILCVGDSHTYGAGVPDDQSFPAHLQRLLDERRPGEFWVVNLGLPGMNTGQVRARLPAQVARYDPDLVVVWVGVNNAWNTAETDLPDPGWRDELHAFALRSRLYRLWRVHLHERSKWTPRGGGVRQEATLEKPCENGECEDAVWELGSGEGREQIRHQRQARSEQDRARHEESAYRDIAAIQAWLERAGIPLILIRYPLDLQPNDAANRAIARVAEEGGVPLIDSQAAVLRLPQADRRYLWASHPNGAMYGEIARDLAAAVEASLEH